MILEVRHLVKEYAGRRVVDDVSFSVAPGEIVGLLGPNGAGKTTTIDMILGLVEPTSGEIQTPPKEQMNFAATYAHLPGNMSVQNNLRVFAHLYEVRGVKQAVEKALKDFDLERHAKSRTGYLSSGEQTRVGLAKAFLNKPKLLLLDEPTASLDPHTSDGIRNKLMDRARNEDLSILWTSHDMVEITRVCDRVLFISHGKILLEGKPRDLPAQYGKKDLEELFIHVAKENL
ncbi:MAG: ABC transporter ATP-binding protein [Patescibacteria group bacterium]